MSTVIATLFDYERASIVAQLAATEGKTIEAVVVEQGLMTAEMASEYLDTSCLSPRKDSIGCSMKNLIDCGCTIKRTLPRGKQTGLE